MYTIIWCWSLCLNHRCYVVGDGKFSHFIHASIKSMPIFCQPLHNFVYVRQKTADRQRRQKPSELVAKWNPPLTAAPVHVLLWNDVNNTVESIDNCFVRQILLKSDFNVYIEKYLDNSFSTVAWTAAIRITSSSHSQTMITALILLFDESNTRSYDKVCMAHST